MPLITWTQEDSVNVREIDEQHQKIFGMINRLYEAARTSSDTAALGGILQEMNGYADYHFSTEEKYFTLFHYEEGEPHKLAHDSYRRKCAELLTRHQQAEQFLSLDVLDFLENWWLQHIRGMDKRYTKCFNEHGLNGQGANGQKPIDI